MRAQTQKQEWVDDDRETKKELQAIAKAEEEKRVNRAVFMIKGVRYQQSLNGSFSAVLKPIFEVNTEYTRWNRDLVRKGD